MANRTFAGIVKIALVLLLATAVLFLCFAWTQRGLLERSVEALCKNLDGLEIRQQWVGTSLTDVSFILAVQHVGDLIKRVEKGPEFHAADLDDLNFFKMSATDALGSEVALDGYVLYRAKLYLGDETLCASHPCSVYVLIKPGDPTAYVGLFKI